MKFDDETRIYLLRVSQGTFYAYHKYMFALGLYI